ncbi:MAG: NAD(P)H-binding protein [Myxococcota bacterium]|nr:NAD(P)H-binding protein [Myxococcota bacterium]
MRSVLLTGASGFVGRALYQELSARGLHVRCASRRPQQAQARWPEREWCYLDVEDEGSIAAAFDGCDAAYYLVHSMGQAGDFEAREARAAHGFAEAARRAAVRRIVYLGGMKPDGEPSKHLRSRLSTGRVLRASGVVCFELRASMIIGEGSESWLVARDLAARLPLMVLPRWTEHRTEPLGIDDVCTALADALSVDESQQGVWDLPGPERLSIREILLRIAALRGTRPRALPVPWLSPSLSGHWIRFVSRANQAIAKELVEGMSSEVCSTERSFWELSGRAPLSFDEAVRRALAQDSQPENRWERAVRRLARS